MTQKTLSVIIPSYNMEKYLERCLSSLIVEDVELLQSLDVIVVNDGSKDRTSEIAHVYESKYPGVFRVIDKLNGNYGSCINAALPMIQGRYVRVVDADDCVDERFVEYLRRLSECTADMVLTDTLNVEDKSGNPIRKDAYPLQANTTFPADEVLSRFRYFNMNTITYRSSIFDGGWYRQAEGISYTDTQWSILPLCKVNTVVYLPVVVYRYTMARAGQTMESATVAKNFWMMGQCALDCVGIYARIRETLCASKRLLMDARVFGFAAMPYYKAYQRSGGVRNNIDLDNYDARFAEKSKIIYQLVEEFLSGTVLKFHAVRLWRKRTRLSRLALAIFARANSQDWWGGRLIYRLFRVVNMILNRKQY